MGNAESVKDVFERYLPSRLAGRPDVVAKIGSVYQFDIGGAEGGRWVVDCTVPGGAVSAGDGVAARCTVSCAAPDFLEIVNGRLSAPMAFMSGKLTIQGDMGLAMMLQQILG